MNLKEGQNLPRITVRIAPPPSDPKKRERGDPNVISGRYDPETKIFYSDRKVNQDGVKGTRTIQISAKTKGEVAELIWEKTAPDRLKLDKAYAQAMGMKPPPEEGTTPSAPEDQERALDEQEAQEEAHPQSEEIFDDPDDDPDTDEFMDPEIPETEDPILDERELQEEGMSEQPPPRTSQPQQQDHSEIPASQEWSLMTILLSKSLDLNRQAAVIIEHEAEKNSLGTKLFLGAYEEVESLRERYGFEI